MMSRVKSFLVITIVQQTQKKNDSDIRGETFYIGCRTFVALKTIIKTLFSSLILKQICTHQLESFKRLVISIMLLLLLLLVIFKVESNFFYTSILGG